MQRTGCTGLAVSGSERMQRAGLTDSCNGRAISKSQVIEQQDRRRSHAHAYARTHKSCRADTRAVIP